MTTFDYEVIISDGKASASYGIERHNLDKQSFPKLLDIIAYTLVQSFASERFLRI